VKNGGSENEVGSTENIHSCEREVRDARGMRAPSKSKERREGGGGGGGGGEEESQPKGNRARSHSGVCTEER